MNEERVILSVSRSTALRLKDFEKNMLSNRELQILLLVARGMSNNQVASCLHISEGTVKRHLTHIYTKLDISSRADAAKKALTSGLISSGELFELRQ